MIVIGHAKSLNKKKRKVHKEDKKTIVCRGISFSFVSHLCDRWNNWTAFYNWNPRSLKSWDYMRHETDDLLTIGKCKSRKHNEGFVLIIAKNNAF